MLKLFFFRTSNFYVNGGDLVVRGEWKEEQMEMDTGCGKILSIAQLLSLMKLVMIESSKQSMKINNCKKIQNTDMWFVFLLKC